MTEAVRVRLPHTQETTHAILPLKLSARHPGTLRRGMCALEDHAGGAGGG